MKLPEILFVIALVGGLLVPVAIIGQWWLFWTFCIFFICFGIVEAVAVARTNQTVSQHFWEYSKKHKTGAIIVLVCMQIAWAALLWHLACKM